jgi:hypothetical protein
VTELREVVDRLRAALAADPESLDYAGLPAPAATVPELPGRLGEVLRLSNGPRCGSVICFPVAKLPKNQFYADEVGGPEDWFCFGVNADDPLFVRRDSGEVWWFPPTGTPRWMSERFERLAADVPAFFTDYVFGPRYRELSGEDAWYSLLRDQGLAQS